MGMARDLLPGLQLKAKLDDETMQKVRLYEAHGGKVYKELGEDTQVATISEYTNLYAETMPDEERNPDEGDVAMFCFHFDKEPNKPHGVPFKFIVKPVSHCLRPTLPASCLLQTGRGFQR